MGGASMTIADEVLAALQEAGIATAGAVLTVSIRRAGTQANPWDTPGAETITEHTGIDEGVKEVYVSGTSSTRMGRVVMIDAIAGTPQVGDSLQLGAWDGSAPAFTVLQVMTEAPGGVPLYHRVEIG